MSEPSVQVKKPTEFEAPPVGAPASEYTAEQMAAVEGIAHVRKNPGMYLGTTDEKALHHLLWEVVDNSVDEAMAGFCKNIHITLRDDGSLSVEDDGRGIPVDVNTKTGKTGLELALATLGGSGKHENKAYQTSGGKHGVGVTVVNALSEWLEAEVTRGGFLYRQRYECGEKKTDILKIGPKSGSGTKISFKPELVHFQAGADLTPPAFRPATIEARLKQHAYLNPGLRIVFDNQAAGTSATYCFPQGIREFVRDLAVGRDPVHKEVLYFRRHDPETKLFAEVALQWTDDDRESVFCFANSIYNPQGGTHLAGMRTALTRTVKSWMEKSGLLKDKDKADVVGEDVQEGVIAVLSCRLPGRVFAGQDKVALLSPEARGFVDGMISDGLATRLEEKPDEAKRIALRVQRAAEARRAAQKAREALSKKRGVGLPGKLADCSTKERLTAEVFLVEGDSAGGSAKQARDSETQAILPLRGKVINVEKASLDKMLDNKEIIALITAIGTGIGVAPKVSTDGTELADGAEPAPANGKSKSGRDSDAVFELDKLRYGKIIIMTDADVDGSHIRTLLLTFFFRHMPMLIEKGHVYVAQPPLYGIGKRGKIERYVLNEGRLRDMLRELAMEDLSLSLRGPDGERRLTGAELRELLRILDGIETAAQIVRRRGRLWPSFLARHWNRSAWEAERRLLPTHAVTVGRDETLLAGDRELREFLAGLAGKDDRSLALTVTGDELPVGVKVPPPAPIPLPPDADAPIPGLQPTPLSVHHTNLNECRQLNELFRRLYELGGLHLTAEDYLVERRERISGEAEPTRFALIQTASTGSERSVEVANLAELTAAVGRLGGKGMDIQRYKGLGEMDPPQLRETTMDPARRTLLRVTLENAAEAERLFSTLMGKETDSRREYIEEHALEVRNLDV